MRFDFKLNFAAHVCSIISCIYQRICIIRLVRNNFDDSSLLPRRYYAFVLLILEYCFPAWGSAADRYLQLLERQVRSVNRLCPDYILAPLGHRRRVAELCMFYKDYYNLIHCLYGKLPSANHIVGHTRTAIAAHRYLDMENIKIREKFPASVRSCMECCVCVWFVGWFQGSCVPLGVFLMCFSLFRFLWGCSVNL